MIELGTIPIKNETSIVESRNRMRLLAEELQFDSITTTRLATMTSELSRRMVATSQMSDIKVALDKRDGSYGLVLLFVSGQSLKTLDLNVLEAVFDDVGVAQSVDSLELIRTFKFLKDPEFEPTKEFINKAKRLVQSLTREELYLQLNEYAEILEERNVELVKVNIELQEDITERRRAEEHLLIETERTKLLLELYLKAPQLADKNLYDYILEKTVSLTGSTIGFFHEIADDQKTIILTTWNSEALKSCTANYNSHYSIDDAGNWIDCVLFKRPVVYNDFSNSPNQKGLPEGHAPVKRFMSIPVMEGEKVRFIFGVGNKSVDYGEHDVAQLQLVANEVHKIIMHRRAEEEIRRLNDELEQRVIERTAQLKASNKDLEAFSYSVSHDLRAPLRAIDGFGGALMEDYADKLDDEGKRLLDVIRNNTRRMGQLIDDLLAFSRTGRKTMGSTKLDMSVIAKTVYEELNSLTSERKLRFEIKRLPSGHGDWPMMHQVWMNLLSNAIKFTGPVDNPEIEVGGRTEGDEKVYWVRDNGVGFDMKYADKLFTVFQRLHNVEEFEGTGIGLALVQRIIHRHGGRVWAEGEINKGATFYFTLLKKEGGDQ